jgi:hypothetical protein
MSLGAALLLTLQSAPAVPVAPALERPMLDAFRTVCDKVDSLDGMKAAALASGWEEIPDNAEPRIERLTKFGRESIGEDGTASGANFRRLLDGRTLFLIVSRYDDKSGFWGNGCRLYHFEAAAGIPDAELESWMGRKATGIVSPGAQHGRRLLWEPGWRDGLTIEINHLPQTSIYREQYGLSGNILVAQAIGGF